MTQEIINMLPINRSAKAVARAIILEAGEDGKTITNIELNYLLFFVQAAELVGTHQPFFLGTFSRLTYGPRLEEVYDQYRAFGTDPLIPLNNDGTPFKGGLSELNDFDLETGWVGDIITSITEVNKLDVFGIANYFHKQSMWSDYADQIKTFSAPDYSNEEIIAYYEDPAHENEQIWYWDENED